MQRLIGLSVVLSLCSVACGGGSPPAADNKPANAEKPAETPAEKPAEAAPAAEPGSIPGVDYPPQKELGAEVGQLVMGIDPYRLDDIRQKKPFASVSYTNFEVKEKGDFESKFTRVSDTTLPNALTFPFKPGETVAKGDMVVTWWQTGGGMFHGLVTGGTPTEPTVIYINMAKTAKEFGQEFPLKANSFNKITEPYQLGTMVAWKDGGDMKIGTLLNSTGDKLLVTEGGTMVGTGLLKAIPKAGTVSIPARPDYKVGDAVFAPFTAKFGPATVVSIDESKGLVTVKLDFASKSEETVAWSTVSKTAPQ
jgi:hypothetical protein